MKKKYLPLYYDWIKTGQIPRFGLCSCLKGKLDLFMPPNIAFCEASYWGYWGQFSDENVILSNGISLEDQNEMFFGFNPLRQNIVLFLAAMAGEMD